MNLEHVKREDWILGGLALLLIIVLVAFPWFSLSFGPFSADFTGTDAPDGWLGILAVIALLALIADLAIERFSAQTQIPAIGNSRTMTRFVLAAAAVVFMALKFLFHIGHIGNLGWGFWLGAVIAAALLYFAMQARAGTSLSAGPGGLGGRGTGAVGGSTGTPGGVGTGTGVGTPPPPPAGGPPPARTPPAGGSSGPPPPGV